MDWAEELKMSIRKTTARKGRRSKSRDVLKDSTEPPSTSQTNSSIFTNSTKAPEQSPTTNNDLSVDINLNLPQTTTASSANSNSLLSSLGTASSDKKRPPMFRRISGGWADSAVGSKLKSKKNSLDDDRFGLRSSATLTPTDDIPIIPDLDEVKDDDLMNEVPEPPSIGFNRVVALNELDSDLLTQNAFSAIEEVDLSILTKCLVPQESLNEPDEVWEWEKLFTDVVAEINADKPLEQKFKSLDIKAPVLEPPNLKQ